MTFSTNLPSTAIKDTFNENIMKYIFDRQSDCMLHVIAGDVAFTLQNSKAI